MADRDASPDHSNSALGAQLHRGMKDSTHSGAGAGVSGGIGKDSMPVQSSASGQSSSPSAPGAPSSSRPSHSRSRSVNLSPTLQAGPSFLPGAMKWDPYGNEGARNAIASSSSSSSSNSSSSSSPNSSVQLPNHHYHHHTTSAAPSHAGALASSPHMRPTSPIYVKVQGLGAPSNVEMTGRSPMFSGASSEGGSSSGSAGSEPGSSPESRRPSHLIARAMEKSASASSLGLSPRSPRSPRHDSRRTDSPSRAYAVPISPRLQALGSSGHGRRISGSNSEPITRMPSPLLGADPVRSHSPAHGASPPSATSSRINPDPELPVDSVWPAEQQLEQPLPTMANGAEAVPVGIGATHSTPIPPSLRDEMAGHGQHGVAAIPITGPASPGRRSSSPLVEWSSARMQRTPSPLNFGRRGSNSSSGISSVNFPSSPLRSSSPGLAAPQPIARNSLNFASAAMRRHSRALSNSSSDSDSDSRDVRDLLANANRTDDHSPTHKAVSQPRAPQAKVEALHAHAEVGLHPPGLLSYEKEGEQETSTGQEMDRSIRDPSEDRSAFPPRLSNSPQERIRALERRPSFELSSPIFASRHLPAREGAETSNGGPMRTHSPASFLATSPSSALGESPPKVRSFIGMPPRSGYDLSDDPDDVGSEDGSVGSGRDSVGTYEDRDEDIDDEEENRQDGGSMLEYEGSSQTYEGSSQTYETKGNGDNLSEEDSGHSSKRMLPPKRPGLTSGSVVAPAPMSDSPVVHYWSEDPEEQALDEAVDDGEMDTVQQGEEQEANGVGELEADMMQEESLTTLERIFLFAKSEMTYHRILVSHSLADWILEVELSEAVEFVIPLLNGLACDVNEVCIAFAPQLHRVMWYFFRNCPLSSDAPHEDQEVDQDKVSVEQATRPRLPVSIFTPLLCALLLNSNATIANATQTSIVYFFARLQGFALAGDTFEPDEEEAKAQQAIAASGARMQDRQAFDQNTTFVEDAAAREDKRVMLEEYSFGDGPRRYIMQELLEHVAMAIGHLSTEQTGLGIEAGDDVAHVDDSDMDGDKSIDAIATELGDTKSAIDREGLGEGSVADAQIELEHQGGASAAPSSQKNIPTFEKEDLPAQDPADKRHGEIGLEDQDGDLHRGTENGMEQDSAGLESRTHADNSSDIDMPAWAQDGMEEGLGDTAMNSIDGASITMSIEEEVAVGRMASISLLAALSTEGLISRRYLLERVLPELLYCAEDRTFFVRKEAAVAMGSLARVIGPEQIQEHDILSVFVRLCHDNIWHVRQAACLSVPNLFAQIEDRRLLRSKLLEVTGEFVSDASRNVRVAALDIIGEVIFLFHNDKEGVPAELIRHFLGEPWNDSATEGQGGGSDADHTSFEMGTHFEYGQQAWPSGWSSNDAYESGSQGHFASSYAVDPDRPLVMAYNMPAVALTLGAPEWPKLRSVHAQLCNHSSSKVRRSLAASLHEIAKIIGEEAASTDLEPFVTHFLDPRFEQDGDVKMALLENIDVFLAHVSMEKGLEILKALQDLWNDPEPFSMGARFPSHWRMRQKLISKLPKLASRFLLEDDQGVLVMLMQSAITDPVSAVRTEGIATVGSLYHLFADQDQVLADGFLGMLVDVSDNQASYRARVATLQSLEQLCKSHIQRASIEMLAMPRLVELSKDDIVDVRLALATVVALMCRMDSLYALPQSRSDSFTAILRRLAHDESGLVRSTIERAISADTIASLGPPSPVEERPTRELVLGPAGGGLHRPPSSVDEVNEGDDEQPFEMDDDKAPSGDNASDLRDVQGNEHEEGVRRPAPSLANSALARRRTRNHVVDAMDEEWNRKEGQNDVDDLRSSDQDGQGDDEMIIIPGEENGILSADRQPSNSSSALSLNHAGNDDYDEAPHHLLSVADKLPSAGLAGKAQAIADIDVVSHSASQPAQMMISLESPERPFSAHSTADKSQLAANTEGAKDPFLAFVADQHFERISDAKPLLYQRDHALSMPLSPPQQRSTFEDDDEDDDEQRRGSATPDDPSLSA